MIFGLVALALILAGFTFGLEWAIKGDGSVISRVIARYREPVRNPNARNYYEPPFVAMIDSGTFWRCPHGETRFGDGCRSCAIAKPLTYLRTRFKRL